MRVLISCLVCLLTAPLSAATVCDDPVCVVAHDSLRFTKLVDFDDVTASIGIGSRLDDVLVIDGITIGERFAGQIRENQDGFDEISGLPIVPLTVIGGGTGQNLGAMFLQGTTVVHGHGPRGYPRVEAVGEGAITVLFDRDQPALSFDIRGGEKGSASIQFYNRQGVLLHTITLDSLGEDSFGFARSRMEPDIAGFIVTNHDPEGLAIDNLRFEGFDMLG